jgi:ribosomal protein L16/L10AE
MKLDRAVPIGHPRHYSVKTTAAFSEIKAELTEQVRVEVRAAQAEAARQRTALRRWMSRRCRLRCRAVRCRA